MLVEIYDQLELDQELKREPDAESIALIKELDLIGQEEYINPKTETRNPYGKLTKDQIFICTILFPECTQLKNYKEGPIPYRVLKEAKTAIEEFKYIYVLHTPPAQVKDPILIGLNQEWYTWRSNKENLNNAHLIARWGDSLEPWEDLLIKAENIFNKIKNNELEKLIQRLIYIKDSKMKKFNDEFKCDTTMKTIVVDD